MDYKALGYELLELVGGKENISKLTHCATRLRFEFYDKSKVAVKKIETTPGVISVISTTFTPVIPALIGGGMMKAVLSILVLLNLVNTSESTYEIINFISDAPFYFMPVLLAYGAAIKFNCSPILAMTMSLWC